MSLASRLTLLVQAVATDIKNVTGTIGNLSNLTTTEKANLVAALNEVRQLALTAGGGEGAGIDDSTTAADLTWSSQKIATSITEAIDALVAGAPAAMDTLAELATELESQDGAVAAITTALSTRVRFDAAQSLTAAQQLQACQNIGIGDPELDLVAVYNTAKA